jgi:hypothetical protein
MSTNIVRVFSAQENTHAARCDSPRPSTRYRDLAQIISAMAEA